MIKKESFFLTCNRKGTCLLHIKELIPDKPAIVKIECKVDSKIIRALVIALAIFLWFDFQFLSFHACYKQ